MSVLEQQVTAPLVAPSFAPLAMLLADVPTEPPWQWDGYLAPGWVTLLAGQPKVGKSTLVHGLLGALAAGAPFLGASTLPTAAVILSEEPIEGLSEKTARFGGQDVHHAIENRMHLRTVPWADLVGSAVEHALSNDLGLIVVDTLAELAGIRGEEENDSGAILAAVAPLRAAADAGLAVLIVSHHRKSGGRYGAAVRGSNALPGAVDVILELERRANSERVLNGLSRHPTTPEQRRLQLTETGYVTQTAGSDFDAKYSLILMALEAYGQIDWPLSVTELVMITGHARRTVDKRLTELEGMKLAEIVSGSKKRGDPARWATT